MIEWIPADFGKRGRTVRPIICRALNIRASSIGVYRIRNLANGKVYVGISTSLAERLYRHYHNLVSGKYDRKRIGKEWNEYGWLAFRFGVLQICEVDELGWLERQWILLYGSDDPTKGYNRDVGRYRGALAGSLTQIKPR